MTQPLADPRWLSRIIDPRARSFTAPSSILHLPCLLSDKLGANPQPPLPQVDYDPKNPHARGVTQRGAPDASTQSPYNSKAGRLASSRANGKPAGNAFDSKLLVSLATMAAA